MSKKQKKYLTNDKRCDRLSKLLLESLIRTLKILKNKIKKCLTSWKISDMMNELLRKRQRTLTTEQ